MSAPYFTLPEFTYIRPRTLEEALKILDENEDAKILNGGIGIIGFLKERMLDAKVIVDIKGIKELKRIEYIPTKGLYVGSTVTANELKDFLENNVELKRKYAALYEALSHLADAILRNRATIVGNILEGLPYTDAPGVALIFDAEVHAVSSKGDRWLPVEGLVLGPATTLLEHGEIVTEILFKEPPENASSRYIKFQSRTEYGIVNIAVLVANPNIPEKREVRIAITSATQLPYRARNAEGIFKSNGEIGELIDKALEKIEEEIQVLDDPYASAEFRKYLIKVLLTKALKELIKGD